MSEYIIPAVVLVAVLAFVGMLAIPVGGKHRDLPNAALVIFAGPAILALVAYYAGSIYGEGWGPVLRALFLYTVIVLPGCLFFVFVGLRKENLFNAYVANLERLGLLRRRRMDLVGSHAKKVGIETEEAFQTRITAYMERFRALYGSSDDQDAVVHSVLKRAGVTLFATSADEPPVSPAGAPRGGTQGKGSAGFTLGTVLPVVFATLLIGLGWCTVLPPSPADYAKNPHTWAWAYANPLGTPGGFAFLGAYFFSLNMVIRRFMRHDLGPNAYNAISLRVVISVLIVWSVEQISGLVTPGTVSGVAAAAAGAASSAGAVGSGVAQASGGNPPSQTMLALAFVIGVFPQVGWSLIAAAVRGINGHITIIPNLTATQPLSQLDGLTIWHESRLTEEDVENVPNMANADLPDLMLNTRMPPHRLVAWVDQAILLSALDPDDEAATAKDPSAKQEAAPTAAAGAPPGAEERARRLRWLKQSFNDAGVRSASALLEIFDPIVGVPPGTPLSYDMYRADAPAAVCHPALRAFDTSQLTQVCAIAASVAQAPNIPLIRTWLAVDYDFSVPNDGGPPPSPCSTSTEPKAAEPSPALAG